MLLSYENIHLTTVEYCHNSGGVSYKEIDFTLLIPMPEVDKKHVLVTKHRYLK